MTAPFGFPVVPFQLELVRWRKDVAVCTHRCVTNCSNSVRCDSWGWQWVLCTNFLDFRVWCYQPPFVSIRRKCVDVRSVSSNTLMLFCLDHNSRMLLVSAWRAPTVTIVLRAGSLWATPRTVPSPLDWRKRRETSAWPRLGGFHGVSEIAEDAPNTTYMYSVGSK